MRRIRYFCIANPLPTKAFDASKHVPTLRAIIDSHLFEVGSRHGTIPDQAATCAAHANPFQRNN